MNSRCSYNDSELLQDPFHILASWDISIVLRQTWKNQNLPFKTKSTWLYSLHCVIIEKPKIQIYIWESVHQLVSVTASRETPALSLSEGEWLCVTSVHSEGLEPNWALSEKCNELYSSWGVLESPLSSISAALSSICSSCRALNY